MRSDNSDNRNRGGRQADNAKSENRIREALDIMGKDMAWLSREAGISASSLSDYGRGRLPRVDAALKIAAALGVDVAWLFPDGQEVATESSSARNVGIKASNQDSLSVPIVFEVNASAGSGAVPTGEGENQRVGFPKRWLRQEFGDPAHLELIQVRGDSMGSEFPDGSWVMFDRSRRGPATGTYVVNLEGAVCIKDVQFRSADIMVMSRHAGYESHIVSAEEASDPAIFQVLGRVVWAGTQLV